MPTTKKRIMGTLDQHQVKITVATAVIVVLFIIATIFQFATWKSEVQSNQNQFQDRINSINEKVNEIRSDMNDLDDKANMRDIQLATINTKLANIEALLIEIKKDIKDK